MYSAPGVGYAAGVRREGSLLAGIRIRYRARRRRPPPDPFLTGLARSRSTYVQEITADIGPDKEPKGLSLYVRMLEFGPPSGALHAPVH